MKTLRWAIASSLVGVLFAGTAMAQVTMSSPVLQPSSIQQMAFQSDDSAGYAVADPAPAAAAVPVSPSNQPPAPTAAKADAKPAAEAPKDDVKKDEEKKEDDKPAEEGPVKLFHGPWLDCHHLDIRGNLEAGYTYNSDSPISKINGPVGYNDRSNEVILNQLNLTAERLTKIENDCGSDYGYRADMMFGTDRRFVQTAAGTDWDSKWNLGSKYYGLAMPQLYGDLAIDKWLFRFGHFYAPVGAEVANSPADNFFYSHTYAFLYAEPTTLTGGYATYKVNDRLSVNGGLDTGWNEWTSLNQMNYFFGGVWTSKDQKTTLNQEFFIGDTQGPGIVSTRFLSNTVASQKIGEKWKYTAELNFANDSNQLGNGPASWWAWGNYLTYDINDCWAAGIRYEYMEDLSGAVVATIGPSDLPNAPPIATPGSQWNDLTMGLQYKPNKNVLIRSEVRWDWANNTVEAQRIAGGKAFNDGNANGQFLWGNDIVIKF